MSSSSVTADGSLDYLGEQHPSAPLVFGPHELKVLSVLQLLGEQNKGPAQVPTGGVTIVQRGGVPRLIAEGKMLDVVTGFSTTLHFPSPQLEMANALHATGIPMGKPSKDSPFAGMGYSGANGIDYAFESSIVPRCGSSYSVGSTTVAADLKSAGHPLQCGDQIVMVGAGTGGTNITKTVTDECAQCEIDAGSGILHIDDYSTGQACRKGAFLDVPGSPFVTIRLR